MAWCGSGAPWRSKQANSSALLRATRACRARQRRRRRVGVGCPATKLREDHPANRERDSRVGQGRERHGVLVSPASTVRLQSFVELLDVNGVENLALRQRSPKFGKVVISGRDPYKLTVALACSERMSRTDSRAYFRGDSAPEVNRGEAALPLWPGQQLLRPIIWSRFPHRAGQTRFLNWDRNP